MDPTAAMSAQELATKLTHLKAAATKEYSLKNYNAAAEFYSEAAEVQDQINGEMSPENADLLYQYGRCLYHVAVSNSDVLGGKVASAEEPRRKKRKLAEADNGEGSSSRSLIANAIKAGQEGPAEPDKDLDTPMESSNSFFQITGDENWTDSEDDDADAVDDGDESEEDEDDFATAYEILDMARVLLARKIEALPASNSKAKASDERPELRQLRERLADTHDLQAEISLENERFQDAINDTRESLALKLQLYPQESSLVTEAHFKLSLALEFASVTSTTDGADGESKVAQIDEGLRKEAAGQMELAIASCKLRVAKEEAAPDTKPAEIADVKEMVADMEQRLVDLGKPPVSLSAAGAADPFSGVLGALLGDNKADVQKKMAEATAGANDLSGLVKHKKQPKVEVAETDLAEGLGKGKRKAEDDGEGEDAKSAAATDGNGSGKRVKFEEVVDESLL